MYSGSYGTTWFHGSCYVTEEAQGGAQAQDNKSQEGYCTPWKDSSSPAVLISAPREERIQQKFNWKEPETFPAHPWEKT
jgi:hypothetical protein